MLASEKSNNLRISSYTITFEPVNSYRRSKEIENVSIQIVELLSSDPKKALEQLLVITQKYPDDPALHGYLVNAYILTGDTNSAKPLINKNYQRFPDYFFARYSYIQLCLNDSKVEEAEKAFDNKFDLSLLYPHRSVFHISEFLSFCKICAQYFYMTGDNKTADLYIDAIKNFDDEHPSLKELEYYVFYCALVKLKNSVLGKSRKKKKISSLTANDKNTKCGDIQTAF